MRVKTQTLRPGSAPGSVGSSAIGARSNSCRARWEIDRKERRKSRGSMPQERAAARVVLQLIAACRASR